MASLSFHLCLHCSNVRLSQRQTVHIWLLNFLHKFCHIAPIITCAWILCDLSVLPSYKLSRETRKLSAHQLGESRGDAFFSHSSLQQHPWSYSNPITIAPYVLDHSTESTLCANFFFSELLLISFFSLSYFPVSPVCCLRSFWIIKSHCLQGQEEAASLQSHGRHGTELRGVQLGSSHDLLHCYSAQLFAWKPSANICPTWSNFSSFISSKHFKIPY